MKTKETKTIKLSEAQKDVIMDLRMKGAYLVWIINKEKYFVKTFMGNYYQIRDETGNKLLRNGLVYNAGSSDLSCYKFHLTELGKTINID